MLIKRFPWLKCENNNSYYNTFLDDMPPGWYLAFGIKMCEEIQAILEKYDVVDKYSIVQVKEKYGSLRWYSDAPTECYKEIQDIVYKYDRLSSETCCECGKPAKWESRGWICPYCDDCRNKIIAKGANESYFVSLPGRN